MTQYLDTKNALPEYMPYPRFLLKMPLTPTAKLIYVMLLDRYTLSRKNNWQDEEGHVYLVYPVNNLSEDCGAALNTVKSALTELAEADLIRRKRKGYSSPYRLYMMIPDDAGLICRKEQPERPHKKNENTIAGCENNWKDWLGMYESAEPKTTPSEDQISDLTEPETAPAEDQKPDLTEPETAPAEDRKPDLTECENSTSHSTEISPQTDRNLPPNNIILNHITSSNLTQTRERAYGEFGNVMLTEAEYDEMITAYADIFPAMLDFLSARIRDNQIPDEPHNVILRRMLE